MDLVADSPLRKGYEGRPTSDSERNGDHGVRIEYEGRKVCDSDRRNGLGRRPTDGQYPRVTAIASLESIIQ